MNEAVIHYMPESALGEGSVIWLKKGHSKVNLDKKKMLLLDILKGEIS